MNPHTVLGVAADATPDEIKSAYRKLAMKHHPDQHGGSEEAKVRFQEIQTAYDMLRQDKPRQFNTSHPFNGMQDVHDMFEQMFRQQQRMNPSYHAYAEITLLQAFHGHSTSLQMPNGKTIKIDIPAGIHDGQTIVMRGEGASDNSSLPPGDLQLTVRIRPDAIFGRQGDTIISKIEIDLLDAILGTTKEVDTLTGEKVQIVIPPNSSPQSTVEVREHGMVTPDGKRGSMIVYILVRFREFTEEQRKVIATLR